MSNKCMPNVVTQVWRGACQPWEPKGRQDQPGEDFYVNTPEVDDLHFVAGIVDANAASGRSNKFVVPAEPGQAP